MIRLVLLASISLWSSAAFTQTLVCQPTDGTYVAPGASAFAAAATRDPGVLRTRFFVERPSATIVGNDLFSTQGMRREVVRNDENGLELVLRTSLGDTVVLKLVRTKEAWAFTQYHSWVNLFLVGKCTTEER